VAKNYVAARKAAGLPDDLVLYSARHSFATDLRDRTGNLILVQKVLGHESPHTTQRYVHPELKGSPRWLISATANTQNATANTQNRYGTVYGTVRGRSSEEPG
jgi:integrase